MVKEDGLTMENLSCTLRSAAGILPVLKDINLSISPGEFVSLLGPSGSGKSTLLKIAAGIIPPDSGRVTISGESFEGRVTSKKKTGYMPQKDLLLPWKTTVQNAALPLIASGVSRKDAEKEAAEYMQQFGLDGFEDVYPHQLSGGMRQRAALLRTFLIKSNILLLDEPFAALDAITRQKMAAWLANIQDKYQKTVLFVTHSVEEAIFLSGRVYVITKRPGTIILEKKINIPHPRKKEIITTEEFVALKEELLASL